MIRVEMVIGELKSNTLHQCLKFYRGGVKMIHVDTKPFTEAESHFVDAKFYMDEDMVPKALPTEIQSTGKLVPMKEKLHAVSSPKRSGDKYLESLTSKKSGAP